MCEFPSWIEVWQEAGVGKTAIFFLSDREVFAVDGHSRNALSRCAANDMLGHGAIRNYFLIDQGRQHEYKAFWEDTGFLPEELAEKLKTPETFLANWGRMFTSGKYFQNDDLLYVVQFAPMKWARMFFCQLIKQKDNATQLAMIAENWRRLTLARAAYEALQEQGMSNGILAKIATYAGDKIASDAWHALQKRRINKPMLIYIAANSRCKHAAAAAWEVVRKKSLAKNDLREVANSSTASVATAAWDMLKTRLRINSYKDMKIASSVYYFTHNKTVIQEAHEMLHTGYFSHNHR